MEVLFSKNEEQKRMSYVTQIRNFLNESRHTSHKDRIMVVTFRTLGRIRFCALILYFVEK